MRSLATLSLIALILAGCNFTPAPQTTPSVEPIVVSATPQPTMTLTPDVTMTLPPQIETSTPTPILPPPSITPTASETPGPYEHILQQDETLGYIVQLYGYTDLSISPGSIIFQIVQLNGLLNADTLPGAGSVILIPRQTSTPTPINASTAAVATESALTPNVQLPDNSGINQYVVQSGDTFVGIAQEYNTTIASLAVLNPDVPVFSCNFEIPSGGPNCNPPLQIGQVLNVPAPTPTPTLSPTPSGSETPTPTPTYAPPMLIYPPNGASAPPGVFDLQWVSIGILQSSEYYLVEVLDTTSDQVYREVTKATSLTLPESLIPTDGQIHNIQWTVYVVVPNEQGIYRNIGGAPRVRSFQWQSR